MNTSIYIFISNWLIRYALQYLACNGAVDLNLHSPESGRSLGVSILQPFWLAAASLIIYYISIFTPQSLAGILAFLFFNLSCWPLRRSSYTISSISSRRACLFQSYLEMRVLMSVVKSDSVLASYFLSQSATDSWLTSCCKACAALILGSANIFCNPHFSYLCI